MTIERTSVNPVTWSLEMGFNQAELVTGAAKTLYVSGQTAMNESGAPQHEGDIAGQLTLAIDNLESVLQGAEERGCAYVESLRTLPRP